MKKKINYEKKRKEYTTYYGNTHLLPKMKGNIKKVKILEGLYVDVINPAIVDEMFPIVFTKDGKTKVLVPKE